jgi:hypothetical protein
LQLSIISNNPVEEGLLTPASI